MPYRNRPTRRRAAMLTEVIVAFSLLATAFLVAIPSFVRLQRLHERLQHDQMAMEELSGQLQQLTLLPIGQLEQAIIQLQPSDEILRRLAGATLSGRLQRIDAGYHLTLTLAWDDVGRRTSPLSLATWRYSVQNPTQSGPPTPTLLP